MGEMGRANKTLSGIRSTHFESKLKQNDPTNKPRLLNQIQNKSGIPLIAFEEDDFYNYFFRINQPPKYEDRSYEPKSQNRNLLYLPYLVI